MRILFMTVDTSKMVRKNIMYELEEEMSRYADCKWAGLNHFHHRFEDLDKTIDRLYPEEKPDWVILFPWKHEEQGRWDELELNPDRDYKVAAWMGDLPNPGTLGVDHEGYIEAMNELNPDLIIMEYMYQGDLEDPGLFLKNLKIPGYYCPPHASHHKYQPNLEKDIDVVLLGAYKNKAYKIRKLFHDRLQDLATEHGWTVRIEGRPPGRSDRRNIREMAERGFIVGPKYEEMLARAKVCLIGTSVYKYPVAKFWEAALSGAAIVSDIPHTGYYLGLTEHETFMAVNEEHWEERLIRVLDDEKYRLNLVENAYRLAMQRHTTTVRARELMEFLGWEKPWEHYWDRTKIKFLENPKEVTHSIRRIMARKAKGSVLDVGCAHAMSYPLFKQFQHEYTGIDPTEKFIVYASRKYPELMNRLHIGRAQKLPFDINSFDTVAVKDVFEHMHPADVPEAISEILRVAREKVLIAFFIPPHKFDKPTQVRLKSSPRGQYFENIYPRNWLTSLLGLKAIDITEGIGYTNSELWEVDL